MFGHRGSRKVDEAQTRDAGRHTFGDVGQANCDLWLHGASIVDGVWRCGSRGPLGEMPFDRLIGRSVEHNANGPLPIVLKHENDGAVEVWIEENRCRDEELPGYGFGHQRNRATTVDS